MRFDHRGLGDSEGVFKGFRELEADLAAAIDAFVGAVPGMEEVVLFGGCDAASGIMINAWKFPRVTGIVLGNLGAQRGDWRQGRRRALWSAHPRMGLLAQIPQGGYNPRPPSQRWVALCLGS